MNLSEFKAWFSGYTEEMTGPPSKKQWTKIKSRVSRIKNEPTSHAVFRDHYPYYIPMYNWTSIPSCTYTLMNGIDKQSSINNSYQGNGTVSLDCFTNLGRQEYQTGDGGTAI